MFQPPTPNSFRAVLKNQLGRVNVQNRVNGKPVDGFQQTRESKPETLCWDFFRKLLSEWIDCKFRYNFEQIVALFLEILTVFYLVIRIEDFQRWILGQALFMMTELKCRAACEKTCLVVFFIGISVIWTFFWAQKSFKNKLKLQRKQSKFCCKFHKYCCGCHCYRNCFWCSFPHSLVQVKFSDWLKLWKSLFSNESQQT